MGCGPWGRKGLDVTEGREHTQSDHSAFGSGVQGDSTPTEHGSAWMPALIQYHELPALPTARLAPELASGGCRKTHHLSLSPENLFHLASDSALPPWRRGAMLRTEHKRQRKTELGCDLNSANPQPCPASRIRLVVLSFPGMLPSNLGDEIFNVSGLHVLIHKTQKMRL